MVTQVGDRWYLSGLILSENCVADHGVPGVFTRTTAFQDWLAPIFEDGKPESK